MGVCVCVCGQRHSADALPPGKRPGTYCTGGWVGSRAGLDGCGKSRPQWASIPYRQVRSPKLKELCQSLGARVVTGGKLHTETHKY